MMSISNKFILAMALTILSSGCGGGGNSGPKMQAPTGTIVFVSDRDDPPTGDLAFGNVTYGSADIYRMNADGSGVMRLTDNAPINDFAPALSPDGTRILFTSQGRAGDNTAQIYVMNADGSGVTRLTDTPARKLSAEWSFDGNKIVFGAARAEQGTAIFTMNADGSGQTQLTDDPRDGGSAVFNRDGSKILFLSSRFSTPSNFPSFASPQIYTMNADGSNPTQLERTGGPASPTSFQFSPDGTQLLVCGNRGYMDSGDAGVFVLRADGSDARQVNETGGNAVWSPEGRRIAYNAQRDDGTLDAQSLEIYTARTDGSEIRQLTDNAVLDGAPSWR